MIAIANLVPAPQAWLDTLWMLSLKATLVLAMAFAMAVVLRRASSAARHLLWSAALIGVLGLVPLVLFGPAWSVPGLALPRAVVSEALSLDLTPGAATSQPPSVAAAEPPSGASAPRAGLKPRVETPPSARPPAASTSPSQSPSPGSAPSRSGAAARLWPAALLVTWATGAAVLLGGLLLGAIGLARLTRRARPVTDPQWLALLDRCRREVGVRREVRLLVAERVPAPCTWGMLHPRLLIPAEAERWPIERRRVVLLHELAHVARHDCLLQAVGQIACAFFWFHPLAWLAAQRQRIEREHACDDLVLRSDTRASDYADHLLAVVRAMRESRLTAIGAVAFARRSQFEGRLLAVLDPRRVRGALSWRRAWPAALATGLVVLPLAALRPWVDPARAGNYVSARINPEDGAASEVVRASEAEGSLEQRLGWAFAEASRRRSPKGFWVGYRLDRTFTDLGGHLSDSAPISIHTLDDGWRGLRVSDVLAGRSQRSRKLETQERTIVVFFHYEAGADRPDQMDRIRVQTQELPAVFERQPLFWLGEVKDAESLALMRRVDGSVRTQELRTAALDAVSFHGDDAAVRAHLVSVLQSNADEEIRGTAAERLSRFPDRETLDLLVATLRRDRSDEVRNGAIQALGQMKSPEATRVLSQLARDKNLHEDVRREAVEALGEKASKEASESLEELSESDEDDLDDAIDEAADAAAEAASERAAKDWEHDLEDANDVMDVKDAKDLKDLHDLEDEDGGITINGELRIDDHPEGKDIKVLGKDGKPEVTIQQRDGKKANAEDQERLQRQAVESLGQMPEAMSFQRLVRIARTHPNARIRRVAIEVIGRYGSPRAFETLVEFARKSDDYEVARQALESIGHMSHEDSEKALVVLESVIWRNSDERMQRKAVEAIGHLDCEKSLSTLEKVARTHPNVDVRRQAIESIGHSDPERATPILERLIESGKM